MLWPCLQPWPWPRPHLLQFLTEPPGCSLALAHPLTLSGAADGPRHSRLWVTAPAGEGTAGAEPTGGRFCSLPCHQQLCNGGTSSSLNAGHQHTHLRSYKPGKINPTLPTVPRVPSQQGGVAVLRRDVRRQRPSSLAGWDGLKFAPLCVCVCVRAIGCALLPPAGPVKY